MVVGPVAGAHTHQSDLPRQHCRVTQNENTRTVYVVHKSSLAHRVGALGGRVTDVVTELGTTEEVILISLLRLYRRC